MVRVKIPGLSKLKTLQGHPVHDTNNSRIKISTLLTLCSVTPLERVSMSHSMPTRSYVLIRHTEDTLSV